MNSIDNKYKDKLITSLNYRIIAAFLSSDEVFEKIIKGNKILGPMEIGWFIRIYLGRTNLINNRIRDGGGYLIFYSEILRLAYWFYFFKFKITPELLLNFKFLFYK